MLPCPERARISVVGVVVAAAPMFGPSSPRTVTALAPGDPLPSSDDDRPGPEPSSQEAAQEQLRAAGVDGAVAMRVVGREKEWTYSPATSWGGVFEPGYLRTDTRVSLETCVYSLAQNKLLWIGASVTTNPTKPDAFITQVSAKVAAEMEKAGLLGK